MKFKVEQLHETINSSTSSIEEVADARKRCLNETMDSYELKKVKANKVLKEQYNIKSDGYPNIIIEDIN